MYFTLNKYIYVYFWWCFGQNWEIFSETTKKFSLFFIVVLTFSPTILLKLSIVFLSQYHHKVVLLELLLQLFTFVLDSAYKTVILFDIDERLNTGLFFIFKKEQTMLHLNYLGKVMELRHKLSIKYTV